MRDSLGDIVSGFPSNAQKSGRKKAHEHFGENKWSCGWLTYSPEHLPHPLPWLSGFRLVRVSQWWWWRAPALSPFLRHPLTWPTNTHMERSQSLNPKEKEKGDGCTGKWSLWFFCVLFALKGHQCVWLSQQRVCYRAELPSSVFKENISPYWTKVSLPDISIKMTNTVYFKTSASRIVYARFILVAWHMMICNYIN